MNHRSLLDSGSARGAVMSRLSMEDAAYEARIAAMVLVDTSLDINGEEVFVIKHGGQTRGEVYADPLDALRFAQEWARQLGCKCDVTVHARNAADMS